MQEEKESLGRMGSQSQMLKSRKQEGIFRKAIGFPS